MHLRIKIASTSNALKAIRGFQVVAEDGRPIATIYENGVMLLAGKVPLPKAA
jgi:hypothetical protein